jgi:hypothetical protein
MSRTIVIETNVDTFFGKTLMLRGFAEFVAWKHIQNSSEYHHKNIVQDIIKYVRQKHFDTIVWDGDLYKSDSFTHIILELMNNLPENIQFVAFKSSDGITKFTNGDQKNCEVGWSQLTSENNHGIYLYSVNLPNKLNWFDKHTLLTKYIFEYVINKSTKTTIMYLGGGKIVTDEMRNLSDYIKFDYLANNTKVVFIDIPRASFSINKDTGLPQSCIQYLGNEDKPCNPTKYLSMGFSIYKTNSNIRLAFSEVKYIIEYKYNPTDLINNHID